MKTQYALILATLFLFAIIPFGIATDITTCQDLTSGTYDVTADIPATGSCINITGDNVVLDCHGYTIGGTNVGFGIQVLNANYTTINNCTIKGFVKSILLNETIGSVIKNNKAYVNDTGSTGTFYALWVYRNVWDTNFTNNYFYANNTVSYIAVMGTNSSRNNFIGNTFYNDVAVIQGTAFAYLVNYGNSTDNYFANNYVYSRFYKAVENIFNGNDRNTYTNNTLVCNGGPCLKFGVGSKDNFAYNNTIITSGALGYGLYVSNSSNNTMIGNNVFTNGSYGVYIDLSSRNNLLKQNIIHSIIDSDRHAVYIHNKSEYNVIDSNTISHYPVDGYGIIVDTGSHNTNITNNRIIIYSIGRGAIQLNGVTGTYIYNNTVPYDYGPAANGIFLYNTSNNIIDSNNLNVSGSGFWILAGSSYNTISNNYIRSLNYSYYIKDKSNNNNFTDETINSNDYGVFLINGSNNIFTNLTSLGTTKAGIYIINSPNNTIINPTMDLIELRESIGGQTYLYDLTNALAYWNNYSLAWGNVIEDNDGNLNLSVDTGNVSYILENYIAGRGRLSDALTLTSSSNSITLTSPLLSTITAYALLDIPSCNSIILLTFNNGTITTWADESSRVICTSVTGPFGFVTGDNIFTYTLRNSELVTSLLKLLIGFIALAILGFALVGFGMFIKNNFQNINIQQFVSYCVSVLLVTILMIVLINYIVSIL